MYSAIGLGSFFTIFNLNKSITSLTEKWNQLLQTSIHTPGTLPTFLEKLAGTELLEFNGFQTNKNNPNEIIGNIFLEGIASTGHPIKSRLMPTVPLIYSNYYISKIYSNNFHNQSGILSNNNLSANINQFYPSSISESLVDEAPYFNLFAYESLQDAAKKIIGHKKKLDQFCRIARNMKLDAKGASKLICSRIYRKSLTLIERIILFIYLVLEAIFSRQATIKGIRIGYVEHEMGVKNDSILGVYGKVIYDKNKKTMRIDYPEYLLKNRNFILNRIMKEIRDKRMLILFLLIPLIISLVKLSSKGLNWLKKWNASRRVINADKLTNIKTIIIDDVKCLNCLSNINNIILLPCEHFCLCKECYLHRIENKNCPKCKREITEIIEVFLP